MFAISVEEYFWNLTEEISDKENLRLKFRKLLVKFALLATVS